MTVPEFRDPLTGALTYRDPFLDPTIQAFLDDGGYANVDEWMEDSGYVQDLNGAWAYPEDYFDETVAGQPVDPEGVIEGAIEASGFDQGACVLTGADGENADDCTTHDHETSIPNVTTNENRAAEEYMRLERAFGGSHRVLDGAELTYLVWHLANMVRNHTDGRYDLVVRRDDEDVEPIEMKYDETIPSVRVVLE